ncbi:MAG TPA: sugar transferase [Acidimicrobiia bacterium]|nr:sugar transferase [Acidimicrobiia bacterium]
MKIAHLTTVDSSLRFLLFPQLRSVMEAGGEAIGISAPGPWVEGLEGDGIRHIALNSSTRSMSLKKDVEAARELWRILRQERLDILHTHNPKPGLYGRVLGRLAGVPIVVNTVHGLYATEHDHWSKRLVIYATEAIAARFSDVELVQSREDFSLMTRWRISRPSRTAFLGNGVDLVRFHPHEPAFKAAKRSDLGLAPGDVVVGVVARLVAEKGLLELFQAMDQFRPEIKVLAIGPHDPAKADGLTPAQLALGADRGVQFLGERADIDELYAALDVFVLPSHREGFPRAAMEAAASGLPVVATHIRGCREVVNHEASGLLVPLGDIDALAEAINRLAADPELRIKMGEAGRAKAEQEFDEQTVVKAVLEAYRSVAMRKGLGEQFSVSPSTSTSFPKPRGRSRAARSIAKRLIDIAGALIGLAIALVPMAAIAVLVRLVHGAPVLYRMTRPGLGGRPFVMWKFRTMTNAITAEGVPLPDAERLTRLGRFLRRTSFDELPELFHVLLGTMSLVGPRPLRTEYLDRYNPHQARRHEVKPGLTGWAQINGRNALSWPEKLDLDVWYVDNWSLGLDLRILLHTVAAVVNGSGISAAGHATMPEFMGEGEAS